MRRKPAFPDALVLIFAMIVVAQIATYFLPAGEYEREPRRQASTAPEVVILPDTLGLVTTGGTPIPLPPPDIAASDDAGGTRIVLPAGTERTLPGRKVIDGTYRRVDAAPLPWHAFLTKIPVGLEKAAEIIFFVLIVGGVIGVVRRSGAIDALIGTAIRRFGKSPLLLTGGMITLFAVGSSTIGMAEEYMPFIPILVAMCLALRMDAIVAMGIVYVGAGLGYGAAAHNPFTVMIAKDIAGQAADVFVWQRWVLLAVLIVIGTHHVLAYARRVQADPQSSLVRDVDYSVGFTMPDDLALTSRRLAILVAFAAMIGLFVFGVTRWGWYLVELAALFMGIALFTTIAGKLTPNAAGSAFMTGASELAGTAILIGFARTIEVVLTDARVIDTVIHGIAQTLQRTNSLGALSPRALRLGDARRAEFHQLPHPVRQRPGLRDDADHGTARRSHPHRARDRDSRLPVRRWVHEHDRADERALDGDARTRPHPIPEVAAVHPAVARQSVRGPSGTTRLGGERPASMTRGRAQRPTLIARMRRQ